MLSTTCTSRLYLPLTGLAQVAVNVRPLAEIVMPSGMPDICSDTEAAPGSLITILALNALPEVPVNEPAVMVGPVVVAVAVAICTVSAPLPVRPVLLSLAVTVTW